ncbi:methyltransferase-like protein [Fictibacillus macauensis ZFHKF-1]|uniref:Methyltransferase-like protein n=1 Tax=Fictibacillus macauensis ZFHKF-1 TaxID=1196324 RepID=I8UCH4_9BACL|nr:methyltransferase-like protein [Fictibacillus macauensis ZFHKF-1]
MIQTFVDLGLSPLSNAFISEEGLCQGEMYYPLHTYVCQNCLLVQLEEFETPATIFSDYAYFSSYSSSWLAHARRYVEHIMKRYSLSEDSFVVEVACNDGYLLQYFIEEQMDVLGIEPAKNVAIKAEEKGIPIVKEFFGTLLAAQLASKRKADVLIANNVLAHVPDLHDFVKGLKMLLQREGVITAEFPHLLQLMNENQFDTIYHEHFSYFSLHTLQHIFAVHGLTIYEVEELTTHGGSLRIYAGHTEDVDEVHESVSALLAQERSRGLHDVDQYARFCQQVKESKASILAFFLQVKQEGKTVVGYGAPAKGNTLLNYCGIGKDFLPFTVDKSEFKQGLYLPGTRIPIMHPDQITATKPDYVFILPWNLKDEICAEMAHISSWGGRFVVPIPHIEVL